MCSPYEDYDTGMIENARTPEPPIEGIDFVIDWVNTPDGEPKQVMIRKPRP